MIRLRAPTYYLAVMIGAAMLAVILSLWWRWGGQIFVRGLGAMIC